MDPTNADSDRHSCLEITEDTQDVSVNRRTNRQRSFRHRRSIIRFKRESRIPYEDDYNRPTAYGEVIFVGAIGSSATPPTKKYVRLEHDTNPNKVVELLRDDWKLGVPKLLISVTGGAKNFRMNSRLREVFRKGLIKAALSTGAWIITGGTHAGVMKYVGDAVREQVEASGTLSRNNVVAIGIASWGVIDQKEKLTKGKNNDDCSLVKRIIIKKHPVIYHMDVNGNVKLDPNHTHFILVDNGTSGVFGVEIELRAKIEKAISEQRIGDANDEDVSVPTVCVAVEGDPNTIITVHQAVMHGIPTVIVAGSGRAADIFALAAQRATEVEVKDNCGSKKKKKIISDSLRVELAKRIKNIDEKEFDEQDIERHLNRIQECVQKTNLFNVYDMDSPVDKDIDEAILHALLRANKGSKQDQLKLTLVWNRIDIAKSELFTDDKDWKKGELYSALHYSLVHNQVDFVKLFLECGVCLKGFLTVQELTHLYNEVKEKTLIYKYLNKQKGKDTRKFNLADVGKIIVEMTMDSYEPLYLTDRYFPKSPTDISGRNSKGNPNTFDNPIRELLIWSVLQGREEMSHYFWEECEEMLAAALTSCIILKNMSEKEEDVDRKEHLSELSDGFEDFAIGVLNECYNEDEERTSIILLRELDQWGNATCLSLAVNGTMRRFVSQQGVQHLMSEIWMGKLSNENSKFILTLCVVCPPLICFLIKFREDESNKADDTNLETGSKCKKPIGGINQEQDNYKDENDVDIRNSGKKLSSYQRFKLFYASPTIKFAHNVISYFLFLVLFSYIMLSYSEKMSVCQYVLAFWMITLFTEEFRQIAQGEFHGWRLRLLFWITDYWNIVDLASLILFTVGFTMRFYKETFAASRVILAIDLMIFYIRLLHVFSVNQNLGPKLIMIGKMMVDLAFFMCILFVFLVAYGVASQAIMFPNRDGFIPVIRGIFFHSYFQMYGELFLEDIIGM
ncbi:transient receptor potential cation channel subfamily M member-like 2 [Anneissia japonica]|uniref:transient receptor potential cation channel subfamily M member-like 2 n=1 Tax=Anneissia japonica TaxID=1529436 RepID=UPI00142551DD|nr:transient receptor potential cation channel subfamily M member-like 2 [Anneissia japonica]